ncbi:MAG TPA: hypothetical protein PK048_00800 [Candidatus Absconditabacterales bacterium]|nr:hypothetical protein [Candidatus Absconditabacterales bacterium]
MMLDQILVVAKTITTLLLPLVLIILLVLSFISLQILTKINKTAGAVKETTFMVNNLVQTSFGALAGFLMSLFDNKKKS